MIGSLINWNLKIIRNCIYFFSFVVITLRNITRTNCILKNIEFWITKIPYDYKTKFIFNFSKVHIKSV